MSRLDDEAMSLRDVSGCYDSTAPKWKNTMHKMAYQGSLTNERFPWKKSLSKSERDMMQVSAKARKSEYLYRISNQDAKASRRGFSSADRVKMDHLIRKIGVFGTDRRAILKVLEVYRKNDPKTLTRLIFDCRFPVFADDPVSSNSIRIRLISGTQLFQGEPLSGSPSSGGV